MHLVQRSHHRQDSLPISFQKPDPEKEIQQRISKATEAFLQKLLILSYYDDFQIKKIAGVQEIPSLMRKGFILRETNGLYFITRGLLGGAPIWISTTKQLAEEIKDPKKEDSERSWRLALALNVIDIFASTTVKTEPMIKEVTELAFARNTTITQHLLIVILSEITNNSLLNIEILKALKITLINSSIGDFNSDDLITVLRINIERIMNIHAQQDTIERRYVALSTISDILDVMSDAKVFGVDRSNIHQPLYNSLDALSNDREDLLLASQAAYAKQALIRVPDNETATQAGLRHGQALVQGFTSLYDVVANQNLSSIIAAYNNFREAATFQERKKTWYGFVRILKLLSEKGLSDKFTSVVRDVDPTNRQDPHTVGNILFILRDIAHNSSKESMRSWALEQMNSTFLAGFSWGRYESNKERILTQLRNTISSTNVTAYTPSTSLIAKAQGNNSLSLEQKLEKLKEETLKDEEILREIACYIPVLGTRNISNTINDSFDLDEAIKAFLKGKERVFLLLGDSGGGKSTYLRYLENCLWKEWKPGQPIPLFINLIALKAPFGNAVKEILTEKGFTDAQQNELKSQHQLIFLLDGYDELKQKGNLYESNRLREWKAKTIITCRTQYLIGNESNYRILFSPQTTNYAAPATLEQAYTSPFTKQQIENYCRKFISINNINRTWEQLSEDIKTVTDLEEMIENPFLLRIIVDIIPSIIDNYKKLNDQEKKTILQIEIFDVFVKKWYENEIQRILRTDQSINVPNFENMVFNFATKLALEMVNNNLVSVDYEENVSMSNQPPSKWEEFFSSSNPTYPNAAIIRSCLPLRKIGPHTYAFIHKSFLEYFLARSIFVKQTQGIKTAKPNKEQEKEIERVEQKSVDKNPSFSIPTTEEEELSVSFDNFNKALLTEEPEIMHLMAECIRKAPSLIDRLFNIIERSKSEPHTAIAAANAITILNLAQVNLGRKNFRGIQIPGADLSNALLTNTDFTEANLENVHLNEAVLDYATFTKSKTKGIELGQKPIIKIDDITCFAISPDSESILFGGKKGKLYVLNLKSAETIELNGHTYDITSIAFSADSRFVISGSKGKKLRIWDYKNKENPSKGKIYKDNSTNYVAFSPDGRNILSLDSDNTIRIYDLEGKKINSFEGHSKGFLKATFTPDGKNVISAERNGSVCKWNFLTKQKLSTFNMLSQNIDIIEFSADGKTWFSSNDDKIRIWDGETGKEQLSLIGHTAKVTCIACTVDGRFALSGSEDHTVRLWDCYTGKQLISFVGHSQAISNVAFRADGQFAFSQSADRTLRTWNLHRTAIYKRKNFPFIGQEITVSQNGSSILLSGSDNNYQIWNLQTGKKLNSFNTPTNDHYPLGLTFDRKLALFGNEKGTITLRNCNNGDQIHKFDAHKGLVTCMAISPDGNLAISGSVDTTIRLLDLRTGKHYGFVRPKSTYSPHGHSHRITCVAFSPSGKLAASSSEGRSVRIWNCDSERHQHLSFRLAEGYTTCLAFSPDERRLLTGSQDGNVIVWDIQSKKTQKCFHYNSSQVIQIICSPDNNRIIFATLDKTVRIIENDLQYCFSLDADTKEVNLLPDAKSILVTSSKPTVQLWELFNQQGQFQPFLVWTSGNTTLSAKKANLENVIGLSQPNQELFNQLK